MDKGKKIIEIDSDEEDTYDQVDNFINYSDSDDDPELDNEFYFTKKMLAGAVSSTKKEPDFDDILSDGSDEILDEHPGTGSNSVGDSAIPSLEREWKISLLVDMGYTAEDAVSAIDHLGKHAEIADLQDFIGAARIAKVDYANGKDGNREDASSSKQQGVHSSNNDWKLSVLIEMGYTIGNALSAIDKCGIDAEITDLQDFIAAEQIANDDVDGDDGFIEEPSQRSHSQYKRRNTTKVFGPKRQRFMPNAGSKFLEETSVEDVVTHLPKRMIGFGLPGQEPSCERDLPAGIEGPPFFYFENVARAPKGVWDTISRFLYDIEPEFVDSKFFCASIRKRGYVHNLPILGRFKVQPALPTTIHGALPDTEEYWPKWDDRKQLNCLVTCIGSAKLAERIRHKLEDSIGEPSKEAREYILKECKRWNMIWVGQKKVAPLESSEMELIMGFPVDHTRGEGNRQRHKALGNAFQVDTVAYHLSVLKKLYPHGINVLSLFSGIGGAEVALDRIGIPLLNVVSVESSKPCQRILDGWWKNTYQRGRLYHIEDVRTLDFKKLAEFTSWFGGFDLVIGGSPCNNLAGGNRRSRNGLEGRDSSLFYDYYRIVRLVRRIMGRER